MKLIGIAGKAGSGKDTVANRLVEKHGFVRYAFADPIKRGLDAMFGLDANYFEDRSLKELPIPRLGDKSPRQLAQWLGTEYGRHLVADDLWVRLAEREFDYYRNMNETSFFSRTHWYRGMVVPDVRFENEADWIRSKGGVVLHLTRPGVDGVAAHVSESGVPRCPEDVVLVNRGTIQDLHTNLDTMMQLL